MNKIESANKPEIELPSRSAYNLAAVILFITALFGFLVYFTTGITGGYIITSVIDGILFMFLLLKIDAARIIVLFRAFWGLIIWSILTLFDRQGATSIEFLVILLINCISLMYILSGKTFKRHIIVGSIFAVILFFNYGITFLILLSGNST